VCRVLRKEGRNLITSSDTESYQIQIIRRPEVETRSRKSNSEQNSKISEASEQEVRSRSSDSEQQYVKLQKLLALSEEIIRTQKINIRS